MRRTSSSPAILAVGAAAWFGACGGSTLDDAFEKAGGAGSADAATGDSSAVDGSSSTEAGGQPDAATGKDSGQPKPDSGPAPKSCDDLREDVDALRPKAIECDPLNILGSQCDTQIDDLCCDATITNVQKGTKPVKDFMAAVAAFKSRGCVANCPDIVCHQEPTRQCFVQGLGGVCAQ